MKISTWRMPSKILALLAGAILAQHNDALAGPLFEEMYKNTLKEGFTNPIGGSNSMSPKFGNFADSPFVSRLARDPSIWCDGNTTDGACAVLGDKSEQPPKIPESVENRHSINIYAPMAGFSDTMFSKAHANQLSSVIASPMVLYNTTMLLTEPGVAGGIQNSVMQGFSSLQTRYLAEEQFNRQLDNHPETKELIYRAYQECVSQIIRGYENEGGAPTPDSASWIAAQSYCMADRLKNMGDSGGENFDTLVGNGFSFGHDPAHINTNGSGRVSDPNTIYLSDYIFGWAAKIGAIDSSSVDELQQGFRALVGDYKFTLDNTPLTQPGQTSAGRSSSREVRWSKADAGITGEEWYRDDVEKTYATLMGIMEKRCVYGYQVPNGGNPSLTVSDLFWRSNSVSPAELLDLSMNGFKFTPGMGDEIYNLFNNTMQLEGRADQSICADLAAYPGSDSSITVLAKDNGKVKANDGHRAAFFLAQKIGLARIFGVLKQCEQVGLSLSSGSQFNNFIKNFTLQLIYEKAGTTDLDAAYASFVKQTVEDFSPAIQEEMSRIVGNKSRVFTDTASNSRMGEGRTFGTASGVGGPS